MLSPEEKAAFLQSAENVQHAAVKHLSMCHDALRALAFVKNLHTGIDRVVDEVVSNGGHIDCNATCHHCCSARVEAIAPEIFLIEEELNKRPAEERGEIIERLKVHAASPNDASALWSQRKSCPFLIDKLCSIYQVRPAVCRKAHSINIEKCESRSSEIPQHLAITLNAEALLKGTSDAYRQLGFEASSHELAQAVLLAMQDPSARTRWHRGENVFESVTLELPKPISDSF